MACKWVTHTGSFFSQASENKPYCKDEEKLIEWKRKKNAAALHKSQPTL